MQAFSDCLWRGFLIHVYIVWIFDKKLISQWYVCWFLPNIYLFRSRQLVIRKVIFLGILYPNKALTKQEMPKVCFDAPRMTVFLFNCRPLSFSKVEFFLKGSLDLIPSPLPSVKTQILGRELCLRCKGKTLKYKKFVDITQQFFAWLPQVTIPTKNLNFQWRQRWWDQIQAIFLNLFVLYKQIW